MKNPGIFATSCAAINCDISQDKHSSAFFSFPSDCARCKLWVIKCRRLDLFSIPPTFLSKCYSLCEKHFDSDAFFELHGSRTVKRLKPNAVPTLFDFPVIKYTAPALDTTSISMKAENVKKVYLEGTLPGGLPFNVVNRIVELEGDKVFVCGGPLLNPGCITLSKSDLLIQRKDPASIDDDVENMLISLYVPAVVAVIQMSKGFTGIKSFELFNVYQPYTLSDWMNATSVVSHLTNQKIPLDRCEIIKFKQNPKISNSISLDFLDSNHRKEVFAERDRLNLNSLNFEANIIKTRTAEENRYIAIAPFPLPLPILEAKLDTELKTMKAEKKTPSILRRNKSMRNLHKKEVSVYESRLDIGSNIYPNLDLQTVPICSSNESIRSTSLSMSYPLSSVTVPSANVTSTSAGITVKNLESRRKQNIRKKDLYTILQSSLKNIKNNSSCEPKFKGTKSVNSNSLISTDDVEVPVILDVFSLQGKKYDIHDPVNKNENASLKSNTENFRMSITRTNSKVNSQEVCDNREITSSTESNVISDQRMPEIMTTSNIDTRIVNEQVVYKNLPVNPCLSPQTGNEVTTNLVKKSTDNEVTTNPAKESTDNEVTTNLAKKSTDNEVTTNPAKESTDNEVTTNPEKESTDIEVKTNPRKESSANVSPNAVFDTRPCGEGIFDMPSHKQTHCKDSEVSKSSQNDTLNPPVAKTDTGNLNLLPNRNRVMNLLSAITVVKDGQNFILNLPPGLRILPGSVPTLSSGVQVPSNKGTDLLESNTNNTHTPVIVPPNKDDSGIQSPALNNLQENDDCVLITDDKVTSDNVPKQNISHSKIKPMFTNNSADTSSRKTPTSTPLILKKTMQRPKNQLDDNSISSYCIPLRENALKTYTKTLKKTPVTDSGNEVSKVVGTNLQMEMSDHNYSGKISEEQCFNVESTKSVVQSEIGGSQEHEIMECTPSIETSKRASPESATFHSNDLVFNKSLELDRSIKASAECIAVEDVNKSYNNNISSSEGNNGMVEDSNDTVTDGSDNMDVTDDSSSSKNVVTNGTNNKDVTIDKSNSKQLAESGSNDEDLSSLSAIVNNLGLNRNINKLSKRCIKRHRSMPQQTSGGIKRHMICARLNQNYKASSAYKRFQIVNSQSDQPSVKTNPHSVISASLDGLLKEVNKMPITDLLKNKLKVVLNKKDISNPVMATRKLIKIPVTQNSKQLSTSVISSLISAVLGSNTKVTTVSGKTKSHEQLKEQNSNVDSDLPKDNLSVDEIMKEVAPAASCNTDLQQQDRKNNDTYSPMTLKNQLNEVVSPSSTIISQDNLCKMNKHGIMGEVTCGGESNSNILNQKGNDKENNSSVTLKLQPSEKEPLSSTKINSCKMKSEIMGTLFPGKINNTILSQEDSHKENNSCETLIDLPSEPSVVTSQDDTCKIFKFSIQPKENVSSNNMNVPQDSDLLVPSDENLPKHIKDIIKNIAPSSSKVMVFREKVSASQLKNEVFFNPFNCKKSVVTEKTDCSEMPDEVILGPGKTAKLANIPLHYEGLPKKVKNMLKTCSFKTEKIVLIKEYKQKNAGDTIYLSAPNCDGTNEPCDSFQDEPIYSDNSNDCYSNIECEIIIDSDPSVTLGSEVGVVTPENKNYVSQFTNSSKIGFAVIDKSSKKKEMLKDAKITEVSLKDESLPDPLKKLIQNVMPSAAKVMLVNDPNILNNSSIKGGIPQHIKELIKSVAPESEKVILLKGKNLKEEVSLNDAIKVPQPKVFGLKNHSKDVNSSNLSEVGKKHVGKPLNPLCCCNGYALRHFMRLNSNKLNMLPEGQRELAKYIVDLKQQVVSLKKNVARIKKRNIRLKTNPPKIKFDQLMEELKEYLGPDAYSLVSMTAYQNCKAIVPQGMRYTDEVKKIATRLVLSGGWRAYRYLASIFSLPSKKSISAFVASTMAELEKATPSESHSEPNETPTTSSILNNSEICVNNLPDETENNVSAKINMDDFHSLLLLNKQRLERKKKSAEKSDKPAKKKKNEGVNEPLMNAMGVTVMSKEASITPKLRKPRKKSVIKSAASSVYTNADVAECQEVHSYSKQISHSSTWVEGVPFSASHQKKKRSRGPNKPRKIVHLTNPVVEMSIDDLRRKEILDAIEMIGGTPRQTRTDESYENLAEEIIMDVDGVYDDEEESSNDAVEEVIINNFEELEEDELMDLVASHIEIS